MVTASPTAVVVWHGMGQQLPFETIDLVVRALAAKADRSRPSDEAAVARLVQLGDQKLWRVELELAGANDTLVPVHVYEVYWAPLTQGKITVFETVKALLATGVDGLKYALLPPRTLPRFLFGRSVEFPLKASLAALFFVLLLAVLALVVVNVTTMATLMVKLFRLSDADAWPSLALLSDLTVDFLWLALAFVASGTALGLAYLSQRPNWRTVTSSTRHALPQAVIWTVIALTVAATIIVGALVARHLYVHLSPHDRQWPWAPAPLLAVAVWTVVIVGSGVVRWFLIEFLGDTAIYVSSHKLSRFFETRQAIKSYSLAVTEAIYRFGGYDRHILVGHSLGSAIAYDTFNCLVNDEKLRDRPLAVTERTNLFLSFGSVLDKIALLFRVQSASGTIREVLAGAVQPLISDAAARPRWVNIYSRHDPLGGTLDFFDPIHGLPKPPEPRPLPVPIENVADYDAWIPLLAHVQYWTNDVFLNTLVEAITGRRPRAR